MVFSVKKNNEKQQSLVNVEEAYSLWDILKTRYTAFDQLNIWEQFAHDRDFQIILQSYKKQVTSDINTIEQFVKRYSIKAPRPPKPDVNTAISTEIINDKMIGDWLLLMAQEVIETYLRGIRTAVTNDVIRGFYVKKTKDSIQQLGKVMKYLKLKAWVGSPPAYENVPPSYKEGLDAGEAYHLWEHLSFRYQNIELTQVFLALAHDGDFQLVLKSGQMMLKSQADMLVTECMNFGIPIPSAPREIFTNIAVSTEYLDDRFMYSIILNGLQDASVLHAHAIKQSVTNDRVRKKFEELLLSEVDGINNFLKLGKIKGWAELPPQFKAVIG